MYRVIFLTGDGQVDHNGIYASLQLAMSGVNLWFVSTNGTGEARITYTG